MDFRDIFCRFPPCRTLTHFRWFLAHFPISFLSFRFNEWISERLKGKDLSKEESDGQWLTNDCDSRGLATTLSICLLIPTWSVYWISTRQVRIIIVLKKKTCCNCVVRIDLVTVFDAILTSRQKREKLQCLYENLMSNNFRRMAVLKKYEL